MPNHNDLTPQEHHDAHVQAYHAAVQAHLEHSPFCPGRIFSVMEAAVEGHIANSIARQHVDGVDQARASAFLNSYNQFMENHGLHMVVVEAKAESAATPPAAPEEKSKPSPMG